MLERHLELAAARITMSAFNAACFRSMPHVELYFPARTIHIPCGKVDSLGLAAPSAFIPVRRLLKAVHTSSGRGFQ